MNLPYWDAWDYLSPLLAGDDLVALFRYQHGPHRQGLGNLLIWAIYGATHWNVRAEALGSAVLLILSSIAALWWLRQEYGRWRWGDLVVPLALLTSAQWEIFSATINIAHPAAAIFCVVDSPRPRCDSPRGQVGVSAPEAAVVLLP